MTDIEMIEHYSGMKPVSCSCNTCVDMCKRSVCLGTPQDILNLINNGYIDKLEESLWTAGLKRGFPVIEMVQLIYDEEKKRCVMLDENGKCKLHNLGLKPMEGKYADCKITQLEDGKSPPGYIAAVMWTDFHESSKTIKLINKAIEKYIGKK
jgi:hypothetical protein